MAALLLGSLSQAWAANEPSSDPIGRVALAKGQASVTRADATSPVKTGDGIYKNDSVQTRADSLLAVTFNDGTTFNLSANAKMTIDEFVYKEGAASGNSAIFNLVEGTIGFAASQVAKTGDMKIATPTASMGIRGTTGVVVIPPAARSTGDQDTKIKLYPDADGKVGRIEIFGAGGQQLGILSQGATAYAIRLDGFSLQSGRPRYRAQQVRLSALETSQDNAFVRQLHSAQGVGRRIINNNRRSDNRPRDLRNTRKQIKKPVEQKIPAIKNENVQERRFTPRGGGRAFRR